MGERTLQTLPLPIRVRYPAISVLTSQRSTAILSRRTKLNGRVGQQRLKRSLGSSLLRHSYLSHKYADVNEEKQADADLMGHSQAMQDGYIKN